MNMMRVQPWGPVTRVSLSRSFVGRPVFWVSVYVVDGLLIDTGPHRTRREIVAVARDQGVRQVYCTHQHEDHTGGSRALYDTLGLMPQAGAMTAAHLLTPPRIHRYRQFSWGQARGAPARAVDHVATERYAFEVMPTPGHSPDHTVLVEPTQGWVFGGDLFIHERAKYLRADENLPALIESLCCVAALHPTILFCGHAGVIDDPAAAIARKLAYWDTLRVEIQRRKGGGQSLNAIRDALLGPEGMMAHLSRGHLSKLNMIRALDALGTA